MNTNKKTRTLNTLAGITLTGLILTACGAGDDSAPERIGDKIVVPEVQKSEQELAKELEIRKGEHTKAKLSDNTNLDMFILHVHTFTSAKDSGYRSANSANDLYPAGSKIWCVKIELNKSTRENKTPEDVFIEPNVDFSRLFWRNKTTQAVISEEHTKECSETIGITSDPVETLPESKTAWGEDTAYSFVKAFYVPTYSMDDLISGSQGTPVYPMEGSINVGDISFDNLSIYYNTMGYSNKSYWY